MGLADLTEANLRQLGHRSQEEREDALLDKMQTLSALLGQVDQALEAPSTAPPGTGRPLTQASSKASRPPTAQRRPASGRARPPTGQSRPPSSRPRESQNRPPGVSSAAEQRMLEMAERLGLSLAANEPPQVWQAPADSGRPHEQPPSPVLQPLPPQPPPQQSAERADDDCGSLISYTGFQSNTAQFQTKRKIAARAMRSEVGSILGWG